MRSPTSSRASQSASTPACTNAPATGMVAPAGRKPTWAAATRRPKSSRWGRSFSTAAPCAKPPVRSFGPPRSIRMRTGRPTARAARRTRDAIAFHSSGPSWAQLMRAMSMPEATSWRTSPKSLAASEGSVTMMRTDRSAGDGPNRSAVWRSSSLRLLRVPMGSSPPCVAQACPVSRCRMPNTLSRLAMAWDSERPSDDTPAWVSHSCSVRWSSWRRAR